MQHTPRAATDGWNHREDTPGTDEPSDQAQPDLPDNLAVGQQLHSGEANPEAREAGQPAEENELSYVCTCMY